MHILRYQFALLVFALELISPSVLSAGIIVRITDSAFAPGEGGFVDVFIRSDGADTLSDFGFDFRIEALNGAVRQLRFASSQSDQQLNFANYVFASGSLKRDGDDFFSIPPAAIGSVSTSSSGYLNDRFIGNDSVAPLAAPTTGVGVGNQEKLLVRLEFASALGLLAPVTGDQFRVSLATSPFTQFLDPNISPMNFTSNVGIIRVASVPEPTSASLIIVFAAFYAARRPRKIWL